MKNALILTTLVLFMFSSSIIKSQEIISKEAIVYNSKENFILNKGIKNKIFVKPVKIGKNKYSDTIQRITFFWYSNTKKKIKDAFAIRIDNHLYFSIKEVVRPKNRSKVDRDQHTHYIYAFSRVMYKGDNYLYFEHLFFSGWEAGLAAGLAGTVGAYINSYNYKEKGIVWDGINKEFNIFRNCKDYNKFMTERSFELGKSECKGKKYNISTVRKSIKVLDSGITSGSIVIR